MHNARSGAHHLDVASLCFALVSLVVFMGNCACFDVGDDLHIAMGVKVETCVGCDDVVVDDTQGAKSHSLWVVIVGETKVIVRVKPSIVGVSEGVFGMHVDTHRVWAPFRLY